MADITDSTVEEPADPTVRAVLARAVSEFELTAEKVAARHAEPVRYPLPAEAGTTERVLAARFHALPAERKEAAAANALGRIGAGHGARQRRFHELTAVRLDTATPVEAQVAALPVPADLELSGVAVGSTLRAAGLLAAPDEPRADAAGRPAAAALELRLRRIVCWDETGLALPVAGPRCADEISLGGATIDATGDVGRVPTLAAGDFASGDRVVYSPPSRFAGFDLAGPGRFPRGYFVTLVLAENDMGGLPHFLPLLLDKISERAERHLAAAAGGAGPEAVGGPLVALAAAWMLDRVCELLAAIWRDPVFAPATARVVVPSRAARWPGGRAGSPERTAAFAGYDGRYEVGYDWRLVD